MFEKSCYFEKNAFKEKSEITADGWTNKMVEGFEKLVCSCLLDEGSFSTTSLGVFAYSIKLYLLCIPTIYRYTGNWLCVVITGINIITSLGICIMLTICGGGTSKGGPTVHVFLVIKHLESPTLLKKIQIMKNKFALLTTQILEPTYVTRLILAWTQPPNELNFKSVGAVCYQLLMFWN